MRFNEVSATIAEELSQAMSRVSADETASLAVGILRAKRIFLAGAGRSGLMARAFAMRLVHLGLQAFVVGDATTPAIAREDLLLIASGSGETASLAGQAKKAVAIGAAVGLVTIFPGSTIGKLASYVVAIPAPTPKSAQKQDAVSIQPMGSLFEQCLLLTLDGIVLLLMAETGVSSGEMFARHANLE